MAVLSRYPEYLGEVEPSVWIGTRDELDPLSPADVLPDKAYPSSYTTTLKVRCLRMKR